MQLDNHKFIIGMGLYIGFMLSGLAFFAIVSGVYVFCGSIH